MRFRRVDEVALRSPCISMSECAAPVTFNQGSWVRVHRAHHVDVTLFFESLAARNLSADCIW